MSDYTVRIRFRVPVGDRLGIRENEATYVADEKRTLVLRAEERTQAIQDADWLILTALGWDSEAEAKIAAESLMDALRMALSRFGMSADLGRRASRSGFFRAGLEMVSKAAGRPALDDEHGAMVFPSELKPLFARAGDASLIRTLQPERWEAAFLFAIRSKHMLNERERTAFDLYCGAHSVRDSQDARFVLLFAALEALLKESPRSDAVVRHVDHLIALTRAADLSSQERDSLLGSLAWLRSHSIRSAGRRFVRSRLGDREYGERPAETFFLACYELRNRLLHGKIPFPSRNEVGALAAPLEMMVGHLLAGPVIELEV